MLGPLFFLFYFNDRYRSSNQTHFDHFAEDTTLFASDSDVNNVYASMNKEMVGVFMVLHIW